MSVFDDYTKAVYDAEHSRCTLGDLEDAERKLKESIIEWHPYPQEKPDVPVCAYAEGVGEYYTSTEFLVTKKIGCMHCICIDIWADGVFWGANNVIAWARLPEPYKEVDE